MDREKFYDAFPRLDIVRRILEDKYAIEECYDRHGDITQLANERNIAFAQPI